MLSTALIFESGMVLQRNKEITIWGQGNKNSIITIEIQGNTVSTNANSNGEWQATLPALKTSTNQTMTIFSDDEKIVYEDVKIGEVWVLGGQSNMQFIMADGETNAKTEIENCENENIMFFNYPRVSYIEQIEEGGIEKGMGTWLKCNKENFLIYSAVGYYFAKKLQSELNIPIGIVGCNWGGTSASCWMTEEAVLKAGGKVWLDEYAEKLSEIDVEKEVEKYRNNIRLLKDPVAKEQMAKRQAYIMQKIGAMTPELNEVMNILFTAQLVITPVHPWRPLGLYESMLKQIIPYGIKGVLWYQGEADDVHGDIYCDMLRELITLWRKEWNEDFPFILTHLAPYDEVGKSGWYAKIREMQEKASQTVPKTFSASIGDVGEKQDVHPKNKGPVGERMALLALGHVYDKDIVCEAPTLKKAERKGNVIEIIFNNASVLSVEGDNINGITVKSGDKQLKFNARAQANKVLIQLLENVEQSAIIEYCQTNYFEANLYNEAHIPAKPFKTVV